MDRKPKTRRDAAQENRRRLISAARIAFARDGYANASMDDLTRVAGLTRGALYHGFGDKKGLLSAVIAQLDEEMAVRLAQARENAEDLWSGLIAEGIAYIKMAVDPEVQRIMLLDGPAVLGDPSAWPGEQACLDVTIATMRQLRAEGALKDVDIEAAARLFNGAALNAAMWVAASTEAVGVLERALVAFTTIVEGLHVC